MAAPSIASLLDFEGAFEDVLAAHLSNTVSNCQILTPRTTLAEDEELATPRIAVRFSITQDGEHFGSYGGKTVRDAKVGQMEILCAARRDDAAQDIGSLRGAVRGAMLAGSAVFNTSAMPYYQTLDVSALSSSQGISSANDESITTLSYRVDFAILATAWPVSG